MMRRLLLLTLSLCLVPISAYAGWTKDDRYCYLNDQHTLLLILSGKQRFVLQKAEGDWGLAEETPKAAFDKWRNANDIQSASALVRSLPKDGALPYAGVVKMVNEDPPTLLLKTDNRRVALNREGSVYRLSVDPDPMLESFAKGLGAKSTEGFLTAVAADPGLKGLTTKDLTPLVTRLRARKPIFVSLPKGVIQFKLATPKSIGTGAGTADAGTKTGTTTKRAGEAQGVHPSIYVATIVVLLAALVAWKRRELADWWGERGGTVPESVASAKSKKGAVGGDSFTQSQAYGLLVDRMNEVMRDEGVNPSWSYPQRQAWALAFILRGFEESRQNRTELQVLRSTDAGQLLREVNKLTEENAQLKSTQKELNGKLRIAENASQSAQKARREALSLSVESLTGLRRAIHVAKQKLDGSAAALKDEPWQSWPDNRLESYVLSLRDGLSKEISALANRTVEAESRVSHTSQLTNRDAQLAGAVARACHALLTARQADAFSLAYSQLAELSLAGLLRAHAEGDAPAAAGYLANLECQRSSAEKALPGLATPMDLAAWRESLKAYGDVASPTTVNAPHPQVDSLARTLRIVRDGNPPLTDFQRLYVSSEKGVHRVEPSL